MLEYICALFAERADEICGELGPLVEVSAHRADPALGLGHLRLLLGLNVGVVVGVGRGGLVRQSLGLGDIGYIEHLGTAVAAVNDFAGINGVCIFGEIADAVFRAQIFLKPFKLIHISSALEAEVLKGIVGGRFGENRDIEGSGLHNLITGEVLFYNRNRHLGRISRSYLSGSVYNTAVIFSVVSGGEYVNTVAELKERGQINVALGIGIHIGDNLFFGSIGRCELGGKVCRNNVS